MSERIYFYDRSGNLLNDPERAAEWATGLSIETNWPGGYGAASCRVARNPALYWPVELAYEMIIRDGDRIVYQGEIVPRVEVSPDTQQIAIEAQGYYNLLARRRLRKRWVDNSPVDRMRWPAARYTTASQQEVDANKEGDRILIRGGYGAVNKTAGDDYWERYTAPTGNYIRRVESKYVVRTGEGMKIYWYDVTNSVEGTAVSGTYVVQGTGTLNKTLADADCLELDARWELLATDTYDENDRGALHDICIKFHYDSGHADYASPGYTTGEVVEDVLLIAGDGISTDFEDIDDPGITLTGFTTQGDDFETAARVIERLTAYGDSAGDTWGFGVWDQNNASDGKPKAFLEERSISDYEYAMRLADLVDFSDEPTLDELWNNIIVKYTDSYGQTQWLTGDDNANLTDATSVAAYGERHSPPIDIGKGDATLAASIGARYLAYHKDPLYKTSFSIQGEVRTKEGVWQPVGWMRAGQRIKILDYQGGTTYFIRHTQYNADAQVIRIQPDLPPDDIAIFMAQRGLE